MAVEKDMANMPDGLKRLPEEYQKTNEGIERLVSLIASTDARTKKQVTAMAQQYRKEIAKIIKDQDKTQKQVAHYVSELRKAGASDSEIAAYLKKNVELKTGEEELSKTMKAMQESLRSMEESAQYKNEDDRKLAQTQMKTLDKLFKEKEKSKPRTAIEGKLRTAKEETGGALKDSLKQGLGVGLQTLLGPLRLIVDPILKLGGTDSITLFDKIIERSSDQETGRNEDLVDRFENLHDDYADEEERGKRSKSMGGKPGKRREENIEDFLSGWGDDDDEPEPKKQTKKGKKKNAPEKPAEKEAVPKAAKRAGKKETPVTEKRPPARMPVRRREENIEDFLSEGKIPNIFDDGKDTDDEALAGLMENMSPTRSNMLKRGGVVGAAAVFLADVIGGEEKQGMELGKSDEEGGGLNIIGNVLGKGGIKGMMTKLLPVLKVAVPFAVAAAGVAMVAGGVALQKRDTQDAKKYADEGKHGRAVETFLLGDRERITEETAGKEMGRAVGKNTLLVGGAGLAAAGGAGIAAMGGTVAAAGGIAAAGGLGAVGAAGLAAVGAAIPPVLIAAAVVAAVTAVAKGTQEAYELEYDKNAASIQRDLNRTLMDEEAPFLKRVGAGFKSEWIALTSTLAGGIRGAAEVLDVEAEREMQAQLEILKKQADEGNVESARLYEIMSQQSFREMSKKEREQLLRSEALYDEYVTVVNESQGTLWDKIKKGAKAVVGAAQNAAETANQNAKGEMTAVWEKMALKGMDDLSSEDVDRLKNSEKYQKTLEDTGNPLKAMQEAFLDEKREIAKARGDLDANDMVVTLFDKVKLGFKSFTDISDEAIRQSTEFDTRRLQLLAQGKSAEEADQQAMEEQRDLLTQQMELRLKQTKEYKTMFDKALKEGKSLKEAEREALSKVKGNKSYLRSFGQTLSEGLKGLWEGAKDTFSGLWDRIRGKSGSPARSSGSPAPDANLEDGIVYKDGKVVAVDDDDNIIATKNEPFIGDRETRQADAVPVIPDIISQFSDTNIVDVLSKILAALEKKDFNPTINTAANDTSLNFDTLRMAGVL